MQDKLIFNLEDVRLIRKVSVNIDDFDLYAQEVQRNFLQKLLGDKLYIALQNDLDLAGEPVMPRFVDLVDGKQYNNSRDIIFRGVKLYCCYLWLYLYMADSSNNITPIGARLFKDEYADDSESKQSFRNARDHFIRSADGLEEPTLRFLRFYQSSVYPEFTESSQVESAELNNMSFRVLGKTIKPPNEFFQ